MAFLLKMHTCPLKPHLSTIGPDQSTMYSYDDDQFLQMASKFSHVLGFLSDSSEAKWTAPHLDSAFRGKLMERCSFVPQHFLHFIMKAQALALMFVELVPRLDVFSPLRYAFVILS